jgi:polysaccharide deacetylase 2 family uncharacterized protein YibQ
LAGRVSRAGKPLLLVTVLLIVGISAAAGLYLVLGEDQDAGERVVTRIAISEDEAPAADGGDDAPAASEASAPDDDETDLPTAADLSATEADQPTASEDDTPPGNEDPAVAPTQDAAAPADDLSSADQEIPAWRRYAAPFDASDTRARIALVVTGLGLSDRATEAAIRTLPAAVSLSFTPYAKNLKSWVTLARSNGHEVLLDLPMEPTTFPNDDPGPRALITSLSMLENQERLDWILDQADSYVGLAGYMGSRFSSSEEQLRPVFQALKDRGLLYLDNRPADGYVAARLARKMGLVHAVNNRLIDDRQASRLTVDARLAQIERVALTERVAVAMARPFPVTLERLAAWLAELDEQGFVLVPLTAVANQQPAY